MVVIPLVVSAIIIGITSVGDNKQLGKFGSKMILYYGILTTIAVTIGSILALLVKPGAGAAHYISANIASECNHLLATAMHEQQGNILNLFLSFIPNNPFEAVASGTYGSDNFILYCFLL